jgi:PEP-CTERM motif-containing protein
MRLLSVLSIALASAFALSSPARADNVTFTGFAHGSESVNFTLSSPNVVKTGSVNAGGFATVLNGGPSFVSYCVDVYQTITFGTPYTDYSAPGTSHVFTNNRAYADLGRLYATVGPIVDSSAEEAAFQIAVWEIAYEDSQNPYALNAGSAQFSGGSASTTALGLASTWLTGLGAGPGYDIQVMESGSHQDVIFAPVPEPSSLALLLAGLVATGGFARRAQRRQDKR